MWPNSTRTVRDSETALATVLTSAGLAATSKPPITRINSRWEAVECERRVASEGAAVRGRDSLRDHAIYSLLSIVCMFFASHDFGKRRIQGLPLRNELLQDLFAVLRQHIEPLVALIL